MHPLLARLCQDRSGNPLIELGLVAPFVVALILGVIDFGRGTYASMSLSSAARAGAEFVSRTGSTDTLLQVVASAANLKEAELTVTPVVFCECTHGVEQACTAPCGGGSRQYVSVEVKQPFSTLVPYPLISNPMTLSGRAVLRVK